MYWKVALGILVAFLLAGAAGLGYFLPSREDPDWGPLEEVEYSDTMDLLEVLEAEHERLKKRHEFRYMDGLHPRTVAILKEHGAELNVRDFAKVVGDELFNIRRQVVEDFSRRNPEITRMHMRDGDVLGADLIDRNTAALPAALKTSFNEYVRIMDSFPESQAKVLITEHHGENCDVPMLIARDLESYTAFMEASRVAEERLQQALAKPRIVAFVPPGVDPEDECPFPVPSRFDAVVTARIMVYLAKGENEKAATLCRNLFEFLRRAEFGRNMLGNLFKIVLASRMQESMIVPCAQYGALSADDVEAMGRHGRDVRPELSRMIGWHLTRELLWYISDWWDKSPVVHGDQIERWTHVATVRENHGNMSVCQWFRAEELLPEAIARLEGLWDDLDGGSLDVWDLESRDRFNQTMESLRPLTSPLWRLNTHEALGFHSSWLILKLRAKEMRGQGTSQDFGKLVFETFDDPWLITNTDGDDWVVTVAAGSDVSYDAARVRPIRYGLKPR